MEEEQIQEEDEPEMEEYEQRHDPNHPYCTNWPVNRKKVEHEKV